MWLSEDSISLQVLLMFELKNIIILCYPTHSYYTQQFIPGIPCWTLQRDKQDTKFGNEIGFGSDEQL